MDESTQSSGVSNSGASNEASRGVASGNFFVECWRLIPNGLVAVVILVGVVTELFLLSRVEQPLFRMGPSVAFMTVTFVLWFWLTAGITLNRVCKRFLELRQRLTGVRRVGLTALFVGSVVAAAMLYVVSWGLFFQTSRFASWEVLNFTFNNSHDLWLYLREAEPVHLLRGGLVICLLGAATLFLARPAGHVRHKKSDRPIFFNALWILVSILLLMGVRWVNIDQSYYRRVSNFAAISSSLNPAVTLCSSAIKAFSNEPISPSIDERNLVSLNEQWSPRDEAVRSDDRPDEELPSIIKLPSIIMVQIESLRSDVIHKSHQGREITPNVNRLASAGLNWTNAYSQSTHSDYADPCIVSSLYPLRTRTHHYYSPNDPWPKQLSYDCLKPIGYATATISSQNEMWGRMEHFLDSPNLDFFYHPERSSKKHLAISSTRDRAFTWEIQTGNLTVGKFPDSHTADQAITWIDHQAANDRPFLLNMNLQSSHFPYTLPEDADRPFQPCELSADVNFMHYDSRHVVSVRNAYFNSLHEADRQVGRMIERLEKLEMLDDVIVVIVGENGEAFQENNTTGHAREPYEPTVHVATVMYGPQWFQPATETYPLEHVDLLPTIFRAIGLNPHPNFQGIDALAEDRPTLDNRFLFFHVLSPAATADAVQWAGRWKYMWNHLSQSGELYDLKNDPTESSNLAAADSELAAALHQHLMTWRNQQLAWHHYPAYYSRFYPPKSPAMPQQTLSKIEKYLLD